ncbi:hypothetical protein TL16_g05089 [Triparma laevis f. inornata]|uniref:Uncharacterized protein n=2 Tax=Triparma laevis TaxID=1534972 RepID=A0A9W7A458_9STRA|nr:hypothetical protein TrLO_g2991 [Triparma laevis f. longispina]GMH69173.1 hypothetical protein TL16_g05089 [Triparma laevis f. inornata]
MPTEISSTHPLVEILITGQSIENIEANYIEEVMGSEGDFAGLSSMSSEDRVEVRKELAQELHNRLEDGEDKGGYAQTEEEFKSFLVEAVQGFDTMAMQVAKRFNTQCFNTNSSPPPPPQQKQEQGDEVHVIYHQGDGKKYSRRTDITHVQIAHDVKTISDLAFVGCESLRFLRLNEGLQEIGEFVFRGCFSLKRCKIPCSVQAIGWSTFSHCTGLEQIRVHPDIKKIGNRCFFGCTNLDAFHVPKAAELGFCLFDHCEKLMRDVGVSAGDYGELLGFLDSMKPVVDENWQEVDGLSRNEIDLEEAKETRERTVTSNNTMSEELKLQEYLRLGEECRVNKEYIMALSHFSTALDGYLEMRGAEHEDSVITAMAVALVMQNLGREAEAKAKFHQSVAPMVKPLFEECRKNGEPQMSEIIMLRHFETCRAIFGEDHHDTIACYINLGVLYDENFEDYEKALKYYTRGQQGQKRTIGLTNPATATTTLNMAVMNQFIGNFEEAEFNYMLALSCEEEDEEGVRRSSLDIGSASQIGLLQLHSRGQQKLKELVKLCPHMLQEDNVVEFIGRKDPLKRERKRDKAKALMKGAAGKAGKGVAQVLTKMSSFKRKAKTTKKAPCRKSMVPIPLDAREMMENGYGAMGVVEVGGEEVRRSDNEERSDEYCVALY